MSIATLPNLQSLARALGGEVQGSQVLAPGPGHSPKDRSLSIKLDDRAPDGFIVNSFANDDPIACKDYVRSKAGIVPFKPNGKRKPTFDIGKIIAAQTTGGGKPKGNIVTTYDYTDDKGVLLYQVVRLEPKDFRQRRPNGNGGWIWSVGERRVLYRLADLLQYPDATVFVCEGEKDVDRVASLGHCATTVACGKWTSDCAKALADRDIVILEDNDDAGRKKAQEAACALHGIAKTVRIVRLPGLPDKGDVSDWLDADTRNAEKLVETCFAAPLWGPDLSTPSPPIEPDHTPALPFIDVVSWHDQPVPEREWCVLNRIPMRNVTLFSGEGAIGKSIVSLQLCIAHVLGRDWLGSMPEPGPALVLACEDDAEELHRRLACILHHYGATFGDLKDLHALSLAGEDALLATPNKSGLIEPTNLFERLHQAACDIRPRLVVLDNSADVFGGSENDRAQVRQFIGMLRGLAISANAGVLLTSHPSLTGISSGSGISGSTAWHASARSRLYMKRATTEKDEEPDPNLRVIEVLKSNYGPVGETITMRWNDGMFLPEPIAGSLEKVAADRAAEELFLKLLERFNAQERYVNDKAGRSYAPALFAKEPEAAKVRKDALAAAMRRLFVANKIHLEPYGYQSRGTFRLVSGAKT